MKTMLDLALVIFLVVLGFGLFLALYMVVKGIRKLRAPHAPPPDRPLHSLAVNAVKTTLEAARRRKTNASDAERARLDLEIRRLETRLEKLEEKTWIEQGPYREAIKQRTVKWRDWSAAYQQGHQLGKRPTASEKRKLLALQGAYDTAGQQVEDERHLAMGRDVVNLEELRGQGVLEIDLPAADPERNDQPAPATPSRFSQDDLASREFYPAGLQYSQPTLELEFIPDGVLRDRDFSGCTFQGTRLLGLHLYHNCLFSRAHLASVVLPRQERPHQFVGCNFRQAKLEACRLNFVLFSHCDLSDTNWKGSQLDTVKFVQCNIDGAQWEGVDLSRVVMSEEMLLAADFSDAAAPPQQSGAHTAPHQDAEGPTPPAGREATHPIEPSQTDAPEQDSAGDSSAEESQDAQPSPAHNPSDGETP